LGHQKIQCSGTYPVQNPSNNKSSTKLGIFFELLFFCWFWLRREILLKRNADYRETGLNDVSCSMKCTRTERRSVGSTLVRYLGVVLCELAEGGGEPGVVGSRSDEPQTEDGIVRHLGVSVVRELAAIHKSNVSDPDSIRSVDPFSDPNPGMTK
jgi:hypothetical protein